MRPPVRTLKSILMHALDLRAPAQFLAPAVARPDLTERRLRNYRPEMRGAVTALSRRHKRLADLAVSFPALLAALANPRPRFDPEPAILAVIAGHPLVELAQMTRVPLWLRKLRPEMFAGPLPVLPDGPMLRRTIVNHIPCSPKHMAAWLDAVSRAARDGTEPFAVWCARELAKGPNAKLIRDLNLLCLWAWYSGQPGSRGHDLIEQIWQPAMTAPNALKAANDWKAEIEMYLELGDGAVDDVWSWPQSADGFTFVPLRTVQDIRDEARAMENCVRSYSFNVRVGNSRLWSIRKDGQRVATMELRHVKRAPAFCLWQLRAAKNMEPTGEVCAAVQRWLLALELPGTNPRSEASNAPFVREIWLAMWRPYWIAQQRFPAWLPLKPSRPAFYAL